jgi:predicted PurR-regulated permease PerM
MLGIKLALLIGFIAGLVSFVPYLGLILGVLMASVAAVLQFQSATPLLGVALVFVVGQVAESVYLTPKWVGEQIGMHPVAVIFAIMAGGQLFGFFGVLVALPVAAVAMVWLRYVVARYKSSTLY